MRRLMSAGAVVGGTLMLLALLVHFNPFNPMCDALDRAFGAPPKWTQVTNLYRDPRTQEVTHGDDPATSLGVLKEYWHERSESSRVVFAGNSQMHAISLASGEGPLSNPEKTYVDLVADAFRRSDPNKLVYRLSTSAMSYPEVVWELGYMLDDPDLRPEALVLQMNYQAFWTGGVRDSMLPMLRRASFRARMQELAGSGHPDAIAYADALRRYDQVGSKAAKSAEVDSGLAAVFSPEITPGYEFETHARNWLEALSPEEHRADLRESFEDVLYRGRLYLLQLKPSTARSITGSRLLASRSAVDSIAKLCQANNIRLVLFNAPVNPSVSLYRTPEDRQSYRDFVASIAANYHLPVFDFENSISAEYWGHLLNGPEPLHMGRIAHQLMAKQVIQSMHSAMISN
jgi:hypothetical protein